DESLHFFTFYELRITNYELRIPPHIPQRRELLAPSPHLADIDLGRQHLRPGVCLEDLAPVRVEQRRAAVETKRGIGATAVDAEDVGLIFDRPGLEQPDPVLA